MGNHFYGEYQGEHHEIETKNLTGTQKMFLLLYPIEFIGAFICMFTGHIGYFVVCLGSLFLVVALMLPVIFGKPIKDSIPAKIFLGAAIAAVILGIVIEHHLMTMNMLFVLFLLFWLVLGIVMIKLAFRKPASEDSLEMIQKKKYDGMFLAFGISCIFVVIVGAAAFLFLNSLMV